MCVCVLGCAHMCIMSRVFICMGINSVYACGVCGGESVCI